MLATLFDTLPYNDTYGYKNPMDEVDFDPNDEGNEEFEDSLFNDSDEDSDEEDPFDTGIEDDEEESDDWTLD